VEELVTKESSFDKEAFFGGVARAAKRAKGLDAVPKWFQRGVHEKDKMRAWRAFRSQSIRGGDESLLLWPVRSMAERFLGKRIGTDVAGKTFNYRGPKKVRGAAWKYIGAPALRADMAAGRALEKIPVVGKKLFRMKERVPVGKGLYQDMERSSALAPLVKATNIAEPIILGVGLEKGVKKLLPKKTQQGDNAMKDSELREKVASVMLQLHEENKEHEKRAHALRVMFKQAELGYASMPQSFSELEVKLAELSKQDLCVLEKALELVGGNVKLGELGAQDLTSPTTATEKFQAAVLGDEF
jgi:hypothetical protein